MKFTSANKGIDWKALSDYLKSKTASGGRFSYRRVAARAGLSHATIGNLINMKYRKGISIETLRAIARGLEEDENILLAVTYGVSLDSPELDNELAKSILVDYEKLTPEDREFFRPYLLMMRGELDRRLSINQATNETTTAKVAVRTKGMGFMEAPKTDDEIDIRELTERIQKAHPEIKFQTVVRVLSNDAPDIDEETKAIILSYAGQVDEREESHDSKHRTNGE